LINEIHMLTEQNLGNQRKGEEQEARIIPANTRLQSGFSPNIRNQCCDL